MSISWLQVLAYIIFLMLPAWIMSLYKPWISKVGESSYYIIHWFHACHTRQTWIRVLHFKLYRTLLLLKQSWKEFISILSFSLYFIVRLWILHRTNRFSLQTNYTQSWATCLTCVTGMACSYHLFLFHSLRRLYDLQRWQTSNQHP